MHTRVRRNVPYIYYNVMERMFSIIILGSVGLWVVHGTCRNAPWRVYLLEIIVIITFAPGKPIIVKLSSLTCRRRYVHILQSILRAYPYAHYARNAAETDK